MTLVVNLVRTVP